MMNQYTNVDEFFINLYKKEYVQLEQTTEENLYLFDKSLTVNEINQLVNL